MTTKFSALILVAGVILNTAGCKHLGRDSALSDQIPGSYSDTAFLGQAYDSTKNKLYNVSCIQGTELAGVGNSSSELTITSNMDYKSLVNKLDGNLSANITFPMVTAGASANLALESQYDDRSETHNIIWIGVNRKRVFQPGSLKLSPQGQKYSTAFQAVLQDKCGDQYVSAVQYGASLFATLKIQYLNSSDKFAIGGSISVSAQQFLKVDANAQYVNSKLAKRTIVTVIAKQFGGSPAGLLTVIPKGIVSCSFDNLQPCIDAFNGIVDYAINKLAPELTGQKAAVLVQDMSGNIVDSSIPVTSNTIATNTNNLPGGSITSTNGAITGSSSTSSTIDLPTSGPSSSDPSTGAVGTSGATTGLGLADDANSTAWNILNYTTSRYDESGFEQLTPTNGWSTVDATTKRRRADLQDRYVAETDIFNRASYLIDSASGYVPASQLAAITNIKKLAEGNVNTLVDAQVQCLNVPPQCADLAETTLAALAAYDKSLLDIQVEQKRTVGIFNYYNIVGGYQYGGKYDDTSVGGTKPTVVKMEFGTTVQRTSPTAGAASTDSDGHIVGVRITYAGGQVVSHGNMSLGQVQVLDLSNDAIATMKIFFTSGGATVSPQVTGLSFTTKAGSSLTVGAVASTFSSFAIPDKEVFVGFIGSCGSWVDSLGPITRSL